MIQFEESQKQSLDLLKGNCVTKDINALRTFNNLFKKQNGPTRTSVDPRLVKQAFQDRGMSQLIRSYHTKVAGQNRKSIERRPKQPNSYLQNVPDAKGAICAAEMNDKRQIFNHLVNTSLITAPLVADYEMLANLQQKSGPMMTKDQFEELISVQSKSFLGENARPVLSSQHAISPKHAGALGLALIESRKMSIKNASYRDNNNSPLKVEIPSNIIQIVENVASQSEIGYGSFDR